MGTGTAAKPASWLNALLENGANPNIPNQNGELPIHLIVANPSKFSVSWLDVLLKSKDNTDRQSIDLNLPDSNGQFLIHILVALMNSRLYPPYNNVFTENIPKFSRLMASGVQLEAQDLRGFTPLIYACFLEDAQLAKFLVEKGANINAQCRLGLTPLHYLIKARVLPEMFIKLFLDRGADANSQDKTGKTPLHHAAMIDGNRMALECRSLLAYGAEINRKDNDGATALDIAASKEKYNGSTIRYLVDNGGEYDMGTPSVRKRVKRARAWVKMNRALGLKPSTSIERTSGGQQFISTTSLPIHSKASKFESNH